MQTRLFYISGPWHQNKWSVLSGHAAETGDADWYLCNFWRLHFSAGQCTHWPIGPVRRSRYSQREVPAFIAANLRPPDSRNLSLLTTRCGYDAGARLLGECAKRWRSEAAFDWHLRQSGAKRHRRHDRPAAFTTSCLCSCKRGTFSTVFVTCIWTSS